jgi:hypothetical protein
MSWQLDGPWLSAGTPSVTDGEETTIPWEIRA